MRSEGNRAVPKSPIVFHSNVQKSSPFYPLCDGWNYGASIRPLVLSITVFNYPDFIACLFPRLHHPKILSVARYACVF